MIFLILFFLTGSLEVKAAEGLLLKIAKSLGANFVPHYKKDLVTFFNKHGLSSLLISHVGLGHMESYLERGFFVVIPNLIDDSTPDLLLQEIDGIWMRFYNHDPIKRSDYIALREKTSDFSFFVFMVSWDFFEDLFLSFNEIL
jgi:hypothetical protein